MKKKYIDLLPINYIKRTADCPLTRENICEADSVAFTVFTLIDIEHVGIPREGEKGYITYGDIIKNQNIKHGNEKMGYILPKELNELLRACGESARFKDIQFHSLFNKIDDVTQSTFLIGDISPTLSLVVFGGTDDTVVGWIEDVDLLVSHEVECLKNAKEFANRNCTDPNRKYIFVGHSKGGMEAAYALCTCEAEVQERVLVAFDMDGPGFDKEFVSEHIMDPVVDKLVLIAPQESFVGRLFYQLVPPTVIKSVDKNLNQHNPTGWLIDGNKYVKCKHFTKTGSIKAGMMIRFMNNMTTHDKEKMVNAISKIVTSNGAKTLTQLMLKPIEIYRTVKKLTKDEKKLLLKAPWRLLKERVNSGIKETDSRIRNRYRTNKTRRKEKREEKEKNKCIKNL